jgi:uncharacterized protein YbjQ (UPF0145 family)
MKAKLFVLLALIVLFTSCSTVSTIQTDDTIISDIVPTNRDQVEVYSTKVTPKSYKIIGQVLACADAGKNSKKAVDLLKEQAALLGADAVIDLRLSITMGYWSNGIKATGTAVKYN